MMRRPARWHGGSFFARAPVSDCRILNGTLLFGVAVMAVILSMSQLLAGEADVVGVEARQTAPGIWSFEVTLQHADEGWEHYADLWQVIAPDGTVLGERPLVHPHVDEQPFTRSQSGIRIAESIQTVTVRGKDKVHGLGGAEIRVDLASIRQDN